MREVLLIRHAEAIVSSTEPPRAWPLSEGGARSAADLGLGLATRFEGRLDRIVASAERKAIETATHIPAATGVEIDARLGEVAGFYVRRHTALDAR